MIGIKGAGMTALAELMVRQGANVTGSDVSEVFFTDAILKKLKINYAEKFDKKNIPKKVDLIVYSSVYTPEKNEELKEAMTLGVPVFSYPEAVGHLTKEKLTLEVCWTHGKTTTSALLAETLRFCGKDPSAIVGSHILNWEGSALSGSGEYFVLEADEYQNKLALYFPYGVILTSVDWDHPDFFPTVAEYEKAFADFVTRIPAQGVLVYCNDLASVSRIAEKASCHKISYGSLKGADFHITDFKPERLGFVGEKDSIKQTFSVSTASSDLGEFRLRLAGMHNALNATAVIALCIHLGLDKERVRLALEKFSGTERRFEFLGERYGALMYDDYAHHPEEIKATLQAFRELYPDKRLRVIFHPHTFSRTKALMSDFSQSFDIADEVKILKIYGSAREEQGTVSSEDLVTAINQYFHGKAEAVEDIDELISEFEKTMGHQDVIITLGAGNVWEISHRLAKK